MTGEKSKERSNGHIHLSRPNDTARARLCIVTWYVALVVRGEPQCAYAHSRAGSALNKILSPSLSVDEKCE